jgi:gamma-glutamyltranspeptidase
MAMYSSFYLCLRLGVRAAFYYGSLGAEMVADLAAVNGTMTVADLAAYRAVLREPVSTTYHGRTIITGQAPSSGPVLALLLNILEGYTLTGKQYDIVTNHRYGSLQQACVSACVWSREEKKGAGGGTCTLRRRSVCVGLMGFAGLGLSRR